MYYACMVALQIRDVPDDVRSVLVETARSRGQSLQAYLLELMVEEARRSVNLELLERFDGRTDGSRVSAREATAELDEARRRRSEAP